jgi:hypothetical protein
MWLHVITPNMQNRLRIKEEMHTAIQGCRTHGGKGTPFQPKPAADISKDCE